MGFVVTFLEGVITFVSPCLLPMLPLYVAYFAGGGKTADNAHATGSRDSARNSSQLVHTAVSALGFIAGFTLLFCLLGALSGTLGSLLVRYQGAVDAVCGAIVIILGLNYLGILRIGILQRTFKPKSSIVPHGFASSLVFGMVFAIGWTPCVGAFLGSALSLAATSGHTLDGIALLLSYSLGLGVPFFITALLINQLEGAFAWIKAHYSIVNAICGILLVIIGALMASGLFGTWLRLLSL